MKRYSLHNAFFLRKGSKYYEPVITESDHGEWVLWEDVEKLKTENTTLKKMNMYINSTAVERVREASGVACNCEAMAAGKRGPYPNMIIDTYWICPVHGYKKL